MVQEACVFVNIFVCTASLFHHAEKVKIKREGKFSHLSRVTSPFNNSVAPSTNSISAQ